MADVPERTEGRMKLWPGMLYGSLKRMVDAALIQEVEGPAGSPEDNKEREAKRLAAFVETARMNGFIDG